MHAVRAGRGSANGGSGPKHSQARAGRGRGQHLSGSFAKDRQQTAQTLMSKTLRPSKEMKHVVGHLVGLSAIQDSVGRVELELIQSGSWHELLPESGAHQRMTLDAGLDGGKTGNKMITSSANSRGLTSTVPTSFAAEVHLGV